VDAVRLQHLEAVGDRLLQQDLAPRGAAVAAERYEDVVLVIAIEALAIGNAVDVEVEMRAAGRAIGGLGLAQSHTADRHPADSACYYQQQQKKLPTKTLHRPLLPVLRAGPALTPINR